MKDQFFSELKSLAEGQQGEFGICGVFGDDAVLDEQVGL
jgi:hypothetical protein